MQTSTLYVQAIGYSDGIRAEPFAGIEIFISAFNLLLECELLLSISI